MGALSVRSRRTARSTRRPSRNRCAARPVRALNWRLNWLMLSPAIEASSASDTGSAPPPPPPPPAPPPPHPRSPRRELAVTEPTRGSVIHGARSGPVLSHQLRGDHAAQLVEVGAGGRLPAAGGLVPREHELLQEPVAGPQFLRQFDRQVPAGSVLHQVVAEVEVHGAQ